MHTTFHDPSSSGSRAVVDQKRPGHIGLINLQYLRALKAFEIFRIKHSWCSHFSIKSLLSTVSL